MQPVASAWSTKVVSRTRKSRACADDPELLAQRARPGAHGADRGVARAPPRAHHADDDEHRHHDAHHAVAVATADRVADHRGGRAGEHDREGQDRDPPRHQPGALVVRRRDLGRHRDVGHLEERVRRRGQHEEQQDPAGLEPAAAQVGCGEDQGEGPGQHQPGADQPGPPRPGGVDGAVADAAGDRVEHDVPRLRQEDDHAGPQGGDAELVGEVGQEHQAGHGAERAGRDRAAAVADAYAARQPRRLDRRRHRGPSAREPASRSAGRGWSRSCRPTAAFFAGAFLGS